MEANYSCEKKLKKHPKISNNNTISRYILLCEYSMFVVHITDNGIKVKINISLFLSGEIKKISTPIKNPNIIFLKEACRINGLFVKERTSDNRKYNPITTKKESAIFW